MAQRAAALAEAHGRCTMQVACGVNEMAQRCGGIGRKRFGVQVACGRAAQVARDGLAQVACDGFTQVALRNK